MSTACQESWQAQLPSPGRTAEHGQETHDTPLDVEASGHGLELFAGSGHLSGLDGLPPGDLHTGQSGPASSMERPRCSRASRIMSPKYLAQSAALGDGIRGAGEDDLETNYSYTHYS